jgi:biotin-(acetyl-CoA carboxylase) ligase
VRLHTPNGELSGLVVGIADSGGITIETDDGTRRTVLAGDAHHLG